MGHVQDTPVSTSMISNVCMICHMKVHIVSYNLDQKKKSKSKIHNLPNYEQTDLKTEVADTLGPYALSFYKVQIIYDRTFKVVVLKLQKKRILKL